MRPVLERHSGTVRGVTDRRPGTVGGLTEPASLIRRNTTAVGPAPTATLAPPDTEGSRYLTL